MKYYMIGDYEDGATLLIGTEENYTDVQVKRIIKKWIQEMIGI